MTIEPPRKLAVLSDIHGNLHALQAVLAKIDAMALSDVVCCGDVVGYGAFPNECCELLQQRGIPTLAGNHDHAAIGLTDIRYFNDIAKTAVVWTRDQLSAANADWLAERPYTYLHAENLFFVHASPHKPEEWGYVLTYGDARQSFAEFDQRFCFIGHSHQPAVVVQRDGELFCHDEAGSEIPIREGERYLINVGSVGQPRDRNPLACLVVVDFDGPHIDFHRIEYDIPAAQQAILQAGLPPELAERIAHGW